MSQLFPILGLLSGLCFLSLVFWTASRRPLDQIRRLFIWICGLFALWAIAFALHVANADKEAAWFWYKVATPAWTMVPAVIFHFAFLITERKLPKSLLSLTYSAGTFLLVRFTFFQPMTLELYASPCGWMEIHQPDNPWLWAYIVYAIGLSLVGMVNLALWARKSRNSKDQNQARLIIGGGLATILLAFLSNVLSRIAGNIDTPGLAPVITPVWGLCIMLAISRYDLLYLSPQTAAPQILATMADGLLLTDPEGRIVQVNRAAERLFGQAMEDFRGRRLESLFPGKELLELEVLNRRLRQGPLLAHPISLSAGSSRIHLSLSASAILDKASRHRGNVLLFRDITERKIVEANLLKADRLASMGLLAAGIAHEINNPLSLVLYNVESLLEDFFPLEDQLTLTGLTVADTRERLEDCLEGTRRVRDIVGDLKIFARTSEVPQHAVSVNRVVDLSLQIALNPIKYKARLIKDLGEVDMVLADEGRLSQVFVNLLINAAQALDENNRATNEIHIRSWQEDDLVMVQVKDTGRGIEEDVQEHIFDAFYTTKPPGIGTGLGLSLSWQIIKDYGGDILVESKPGRGSIFTVRLPRSRTA